VELRLTHAEFGYQPGRPVLVNLSLSVEPGDPFFVAGQAGSGKSTLAKLLTGALIPQRGAVNPRPEELRQRSILLPLLEISPQPLTLLDYVEFLARHLLTRPTRRGWRRKLSDFLDGYGVTANRPTTTLGATELRLGLLASLIWLSPPLLVVDDFLRPFPPPLRVRALELVREASSRMAIVLLDTFPESDRFVEGLRRAQLAGGTILPYQVHRGIALVLSLLLRGGFPERPKLLFRGLEEVELLSAEAPLLVVKVLSPLGLSSLFGRLTEEGYEVREVSTLHDEAELAGGGTFQIKQGPSAG